MVTGRCASVAVTGVSDGQRVPSSSSFACSTNWKKSSFGGGLCNFRALNSARRLIYQGLLL
jgi:hypothetical protein